MKKKLSLITLFFFVSIASVFAQFHVSSPDLVNESEMAKKYTCDGADISPTIIWKNLPPTTLSIAVLVEDPDAPNGSFCHWIIYNIEPKSGALPSGIKPGISPKGEFNQGQNDFSVKGYSGPCPPKGKTHRYIFTVYALDSLLPDYRPVDASEFKRLISDHILAKATITGLYKK
ncbi:hypothetical protein FUAX_20150 [Fulvitalea axinellae]|uniref:YbhB/YbcL family Raf kinase inhibitor-like protein n=1 Tax=Fulvitalea axinellae TaxID=1182444 RepID=A0AAU9CHR4_9BACT|nr:hypothetical protein FUAX_20150 [Fulvitalea axinellae]